MAEPPTEKRRGRPPKPAVAAKAAAREPRIEADEPGVPTVCQRLGKRTRKLTVKGWQLAVNQARFT